MNVQRWRCIVCGFEYDESLGLPGDGIVAGTAWAAVPSTWCCADCGAGKAEFEMVPIE